MIPAVLRVGFVRIACMHSDDDGSLARDHQRPGTYRAVTVVPVNHWAIPWNAEFPIIALSSSHKIVNLAGVDATGIGRARVAKKKPPGRSPDGRFPATAGRDFSEADGMRSFQPLIVGYAGGVSIRPTPLILIARVLSTTARQN